MEIKLFTCIAENERVDKSLYIDNELSINGTLKGSTSVIDPIIIIENSNPAIEHYNYMYIPDFGRYYFINNITSIRTNLWEIQAHVDVLYTWKASIQQMKAIIDKTEDASNANLYIDDGGFVMDTRKYNKVLPFSKGLDLNGEYILICAGGE